MCKVARKVLFVYYEHLYNIVDPGLLLFQVDNYGLATIRRSDQRLGRNVRLYVNRKSSFVKRGRPSRGFARKRSATT